MVAAWWRLDSCGCEESQQHLSRAKLATTSWHPRAVSSACGCSRSCKPWMSGSGCMVGSCATLCRLVDHRGTTTRPPPGNRNGADTTGRWGVGYRSDWWTTAPKYLDATQLAGTQRWWLGVCNHDACPFVVLHRARKVWHRILRLYLRRRDRAASTATWQRGNVWPPHRTPAVQPSRMIPAAGNNKKRGSQAETRPRVHGVQPALATNVWARGRTAAEARCGSCGRGRRRTGASNGTTAPGCCATITHPPRVAGGGAEARGRVARVVAVGRRGDGVSVGCGAAAAVRACARTATALAPAAG